MALAEQPLKKRKLHESVIDPHGFQHSFVSTLSQDEILRKQRNKGEIRSLYDYYKRIKFCISQKDARLMPDFEQAYLALITASRGCNSAQRILAELIPRYASHCPTALEAAVKVTINMYNWNFTTIMRGDDSDGVAFQTAEACIFGLMGICCTASSEAPTSSVIRGICSAVFLNVLTFFVSSFDGKDIYRISDESIVKVGSSLDLFLELKQKLAGGDEPTLSKLFKFRVLSLLRIFFCCPKNLLEACFELFKSSSADVVSFEGGKYFLRQLTSQISSADVTSVKTTDEVCKKVVEVGHERLATDENSTSGDASAVIKNCLVGMAFTKDPSLRRWVLLKYKKLCKLVSSQAVSDISSAFEGVFKSFSASVKEVDCQEDSDEDNSDPSKYISRQYLIPKLHDNCSEKSDKGHNPRMPSASTSDGFHEHKDFDDKFSRQSRKPSNSVAAPDLHVRSVTEKLNHECEGLWPMKSLETGGRGDSCSDMQPVQNNFLSPVNTKALNLRKDAVESGNNLIRLDKNQTVNDFSTPTMRSISGCGSNVLASPDQHSSGRYHSSTVWYFDGDSAAMDVYSASKQLWLGCLSPDASEIGVRFQVEKFGPVQQFLFFSAKGFSLVEYTNIMDAVKAREYMRKSSPWGARLQVKFLDVGLGSRGSINGVAVGSSSHVYVGNVSSQWIKDEILHEVRRVGFRNHMVSDLTSENALLIEFNTAEEAAVVMAHLRKHRKQNGYHISVNRSLTSKENTSDVSRSHMDGGRVTHTPIAPEQRSNTSVNMPSTMMGSPHIPNVYDAPENCKMRVSQLSSLILSLSSKYNISRGYHAIVTRDEDKVPTNTLWIGLPHISSTYITDDELMNVCSHAVGNVGSVVRLTRENMQMSSCWFVELSSVEAAIIALKNLRSCPGMFFQIEYSQPGKNCSTPFVNRSESGTHELISPRMDSENRGTMVNSGAALPMNWDSSGCPQIREAGAGNYSTMDGPNSNMAANLSQANHAASHASGQMWTYSKPESELQFSAAGSMQCPPIALQGPPILPPQQNQAPPFMRPMYVGPRNSWDGHAVNHPLPPNHIRPNNFHINVGPAPFIPASVTPLAQISGGTMQHADQRVTVPPVLPLSSIPPPSMVPPLPPSPPPLPVSQPPLVPPPPSSPPPVQSSVEASYMEKAAQGLQYQWQGVLCKSGVNYCTIYARREDTEACKYSNVVSEPAGWPAKLDVTKRTDFQHVRGTFTSTPPHKREVCRLLPSTSGDHKGFQDFISYLKQRECAGVIKIPAGNSMWARLLFILPYSQEACSMLAIAPQPSDCLIALVLPKETNFEWV